MSESEYIPWNQIVERINAGLKRPMTRQLFWQSLRPLWEEEARLDKAADRPVSFVTVGHVAGMRPEAVEQWAAYVAYREQMIDAGKWPAKRPYSLGDKRLALAALAAASAE